MATAQKYPPLKQPTQQGHYFIAEQGQPIHLVQVCVSHNRYYALLPDEDYRYDIGMWDGALWFGPVEKEDFRLFGDSRGTDISHTTGIAITQDNH